MAFRRVSTRRHTANMNHMARTRVSRQGPCAGLTAVIVCRVSESGTRRTQIFAVCHMSGTQRTLFCRHAPSRALTDVIICRVFRVTYGKHGPHGKYCVCRVPQSSTRRTRKKIHVFASKFFLHSPYFVWYSRFEYDIFIDILVVFN